jgi:UDP-3-O-acyl-N-acetylglucosamine deacetylase
MLGQRTLRNSIRATGIGLHTGKKIMMTLKPAPPDYGYLFPPRRSAAAGGYPGARRECR